MYSSLDRIDIVTKPVHGMVRYVQSDHRTTAEMQEDPNLSTIFALIRVIQPQRLAESESLRAVVFYQCPEAPPPFLRGAIECAGGVISVSFDGIQSDNFQPSDLRCDETKVGTIATRAFSSIVSNFCSRERVPMSLRGLMEYEAKVQARRPSKENDEVAYWTDVVELGALAGEVIRQGSGGRWAYLPNHPGTLPLFFIGSHGGQEAIINPLGKVVKFIQNGEEDRPSALVEMLLDKEKG